MGRHKKNKTVHIEEKPEEKMTDIQELDSIQTEIDLARQELERTKLELEEKKKEISQQSTARRELDEQERAIVAKQIARNNDTDSKKSVIAAQKAYDCEKITGKFMNRRAPGQPVKLTYIKYDDDPVKWYPFDDGKIYTIPRGFADQINEHYYTPGFTQKQGEMGTGGNSSAIHEVDTSNKKYAFVPVNFN